VNALLSERNLLYALMTITGRIFSKTRTALYKVSKKTSPRIGSRSPAQAIGKRW
jgi:hypothetical protein